MGFRTLTPKLVSYGANMGIHSIAYIGLPRKSQYKRIIFIHYMHILVVSGILNGCLSVMLRCFGVF